MRCVERSGWLARVPLWARIAVPVLLVVVIVAAVMALVTASSGRGAGGDPVADARALCYDAALEELASFDRAEGEVSQSLEVTRLTDDEYRVQGTASYEDEDGQMQYGQVRCVVRDVDGELALRSVRFGF
jgi:hypothetical protein